MTTQYFSLTLQASALINTDRRTDNSMTTQGLIPGRVLRGALAAAWRRRTPNPDAPAQRARFERLFEGGVRFAPAFLSSPPLSLAYLVHKYRPRANCVPVYDAADGAAPTSCPTCKQPLVSARGLGSSDRPTTFRHISLRVRDDGVAAHGDLVSRRLLVGDQVFHGHVIGEDADLMQLSQLASLWVGSRRTAHGLSHVSWHPDAPAQADEHAPGVQRVDEKTVVLRLTTPAVFVDDEGRPSDRPNAHDLAPLGNATVAQAWTRWDDESGWHLASGLPKATDLCVTAGSTYRITTVEPVDQAALDELALRGVGLRRHEGLGHLRGRSTWLPGERPRAEALHQATPLLWGSDNLVKRLRSWAQPGRSTRERNQQRSQIESHNHLSQNGKAQLKTFFDRPVDAGLALRLYDELPHREHDEGRTS